jgi:hypothetical protein
MVIISTKWMFEKMEKKNKIPEIPHQAPPLASSSASPAGRTVARRVAPDDSAVGGDEPVLAIFGWGKYGKFTV